MLARRFITLVMTALLLTCPLLGGPLLGGVECCEMGPCATDSARHDCGCHKQGQPCQTPHEPQRPCDDRSDCICKGAIVVDTFRCPDWDEYPGVLAVFIDDSNADLNFVGWSSREPTLNGNCHFPPLISGRDICTLVESHLL